MNAPRKLYADVIRVVDNKEMFAGERLQHHQFGYAADFDQIVARTDAEDSNNEPTYVFFPNEFEFEALAKFINISYDRNHLPLGDREGYTPPDGKPNGDYKDINTAIETFFTQLGAFDSGGAIDISHEITVLINRVDQLSQLGHYLGYFDVYIARDPGESVVPTNTDYWTEQTPSVIPTLNDFITVGYDNRVGTENPGGQSRYIITAIDDTNGNITWEFNAKYLGTLIEPNDDVNDMADHTAISNNENDAGEDDKYARADHRHELPESAYEHLVTDTSVHKLPGPTAPEVGSVLQVGANNTLEFGTPTLSANHPFIGTGSPHMFETPGNNKYLGTSETGVPQWLDTDSIEPSIVNDGELNLGVKTTPSSPSPTTSKIFSANQESASNLVLAAGDNITLGVTDTSTTKTVTINAEAGDGGSRVAIFDDPTGAQNFSSLNPNWLVLTQGGADSVNDGNLRIQINGGAAGNLFSANESADKTLRFTAGQNVNITQAPIPSDGGVNVTIDAAASSIGDVPTSPDESIYVRAARTGSTVGNPFWANYSLRVNGVVSPIVWENDGAGSVAFVDISPPDNDTIMVNTPHIIRIIGGSSATNLQYVRVINGVEQSYSPNEQNAAREFPVNKSWIVIEERPNATPDNPILTLWTKIRNTNGDSINRGAYFLNKLGTTVSLRFGDNAGSAGSGNLTNIPAGHAMHVLFSERGISNPIGESVSFLPMD